MAGRLADHLELALEAHGIRASCKADGPLVAFLTPLINAVYGKDLENEAIEKTLKRRAKQLQRGKNVANDATAKPVTRRARQRRK